MSSNRRKFMKLAGATAAVAGGWGRNTGCGSDARSVQGGQGISVDGTLVAVCPSHHL
jgi:hypothetical protein